MTLRDIYGRVYKIREILTDEQWDRSAAVLICDGLLEQIHEELKNEREASQ